MLEVKRPSICNLKRPTICILEVKRVKTLNILGNVPDTLFWKYPSRPRAYVEVPNIRVRWGNVPEPFPSPSRPRDEYPA
ncbi:hypothetical protein HanHA89_Chr09g0318171 [Helianthus annuus]|nr:hypothetical protein HanHA89_Chr09g0318171 [Helianthus annuus]